MSLPGWTHKPLPEGTLQKAGPHLSDPLIVREQIGQERSRLHYVAQVAAPHPFSVLVPPGSSKTEWLVR
jgi:hypothetical protein